MDSFGCAGLFIERYEYDQNSNRSYALGPAGEVSAASIIVDDQDRLIEYGDLRFDYNEQGELNLRENTLTGDWQTFEYDVRHNLLRVEASGGDVIEYVVDARARRVGKTLNGSLVQGFLYAGALEPVAELDGAGQVVTRFIYGLRKNVPDYMVRDGATYAVVADHLGSVVAVVDVQTAYVVQELEYDAWGRIVVDTNPGFQPFGYAGGIHDRDTGLVRFGARDYDPETGRWTAKDPSQFAGGDFGLYSYGWSDPVNLVDGGGRYPGEPFWSREEAAKDFFENYGDVGNLDELCADIYRDGPNTFWYDEPEMGWELPNGQLACGEPLEDLLEYPADSMCHTHTPAVEPFPSKEDQEYCDTLPGGCYTFGYGEPGNPDKVPGPEYSETCFYWVNGSAVTC